MTSLSNVGFDTAGSPINGERIAHQACHMTSDRIPYSTQMTVSPPFTSVRSAFHCQQAMEAASILSPEQDTHVPTSPRPLINGLVSRPLRHIIPASTSHLALKPMAFAYCPSLSQPAELPPSTEGTRLEQLEVPGQSSLSQLSVPPPPLRKGSRL
ncbi:unnamed protein product, partial [Protopolystoma xenopodis]